MYCLMCDQTYDLPSTDGDFVCQRCADGIEPDGNRYNSEAMNLLRGRVTAARQGVIDIATPYMLEHTKAGLIYAYKDAVDILSRMTKANAVKVLNKHLEGVENE